MEFPDTGRTVYLSARNQTGADDNGISIASIGYNA